MFIHFRSIRVVILTISIILSFSCCRKNPPKTSDISRADKHPPVANLVSPEQGSVYTWGDSIEFSLEFDIQTDEIDSIRILSGNSATETFTGNFENIYWHTDRCRVGQNTLRLSVYFSDSLVESHSVNVVLLSDVLPVTYNYTVINSFPHDQQAFTQGLLFHNGYLYESTGGYEGSSSLRIVDIVTGKPEKIIPMKNPDIFAEGISAFNDMIYQITYKSKIGFIYNISNLEEIRSFNYQLNEGWGLTSDTKNLIMSDGSANLYIFEPEFFTQIDQINVFDNKGMVSLLNEMEYINGQVLANVYGESYVVIIDLKTGKVTGRLDLDNLIPEGTKGDMGKVLNGIAFNPLTNHLYITGKNWPVLYEIMVVPSL